jgi:lysozyme family protein
MKSNYNDCLTRLLKDEGGYTNNPSDSGGPTNFGITLGDYRKYINPQGAAKDVRNMGVAQAKVIYKSKYWDALDCDSLPSGVDYSCFDYGVNSGLGRPRKALQRFKSLKGTELIDAINNERAAFLKALEASQPKDQVFDKGWMRRVEGVRAYSKVLAGQKPSTGTSAGAAGAVVVAGGAAIASTPQHYWPWIIGGTIAAAIIVFIGFEVYKFKESK